MLVADPHYPVPDLREDQSSALPKDAQLRVDFDPDALAEYGLGRPERGRHPAERLERVGLSEIVLLACLGALAAVSGRHGSDIGRADDRGGNLYQRLERALLAIGMED